MRWIVNFVIITAAGITSQERGVIGSMPSPTWRLRSLSFKVSMRVSSRPSITDTNRAS